ncbi:MAG: hypothetical protein WBP94_05520 [Rhodomicrobiaceae bacterium]
MNYSSHIYYDPPPPPPDGPDGTLIFILLFAGLIAALIWLINWEPEKEKDKDKDKVLKDVNKAFDDLRNQAVIFDRKEFISALNEAERRVTDAIR